MKDPGSIPLTSQVNDSRHVKAAMAKIMIGRVMSPVKAPASSERLQAKKCPDCLFAGEVHERQATRKRGFPAIKVASDFDVEDKVHQRLGVSR